MNEAYNKSLQMMRYLKIRLTRKQYTELAKRFNLLSTKELWKYNYKYTKREIVPNGAFLFLTPKVCYKQFCAY